MYNDYFGLNQAPFKITPDTKLFFPGGNRGAILDALIYAIVSGEGIIKVVGEVGSGKTMLCRMLGMELPDSVEIVYLANPSLSPDNILHAIAFELKLPVESNDERLKVMNELQKYLLERHAENHQVVVFVEEAQSMPIATLEEIRLLSNLETQQNKLLQIVLFGQPELDQMISKREIRQLKERITYSFYLDPFKHIEIRDYLNARLHACGYRSSDLFSSSAIRKLARYSNGLLRRINILSDKAMLAAYAVNTHQVTAKHVNIAARDSEFILGWQRYKFTMLTISLIAIVLLFATWIFPLEFIKNSTTWYNSKDTSSIQGDAGVDFVVQDDVEETEVTLNLIESSSSGTVYHMQDETKYYEYKSAGELATPNLAFNIGSDAIFNMPIPLEDEDLLIQQLHQLPPEVVSLTGDEGACRLCSSIIYRPVIKPENL